MSRALACRQRPTPAAEDSRTRPRTPRSREMPRHAPPPRSALLCLEAPQVVHDVPDVGLRHLALEALHLELRAGAVADDEEDLTVGGSAIPLLVGEIRRMCALWRHRPVALGVGVVAEAAVLLKQRLPRLDRFWRRRHRVLQLLAFVAAAGLLRRKRQGEQPDQRDRGRCDDCSRKTTHISAISFIYADRRGADSMPKPDPCAAGTFGSGGLRPAK